MSNNLVVGLPRMNKEHNEKRDFCPELVSDVVNSGAQVVLESGYGSGLGFEESDYYRLSPRIHFATHSETYKQDYVLVLRYPNEDEILLMKPGSCLISMIHCPTRPKRVLGLRELGINMISLDSLKDDYGKRLVENLRGVAWNGVEVAFDVLSKIYPSPGFAYPDRLPVRVTLLGSGWLAGYVIQAATRYGNEDFHQIHVSKGCPGVIVTVVDYDITNKPRIIKDILCNTDLLIDATQRIDSSKPIIPNSWISLLPEHVVILDLAVDPYDFTQKPPCVKGIEGIPGGNLDQYIFNPDDPIYETIPVQIPSHNRRYVVSCYSWPGLHPKECMELYGSQISPILRVLVKMNGIQNITPNGNMIERAISRANCKDDRHM